ncbi:MAG: hypothetical protein HY360_03785 [Verrucomicrobia bacterium]|nr:hypothetical protein [Verrucomicrobiota bacterium]
MRLPPALKAPVIDGKMETGEWDGAFQGFGVIRNAAPHVLEVRKTRYWFTYDSERIYIAMQTELPPWGKLDGKRRRQPMDAARDDSLEIFVNPARPPGSAEESYCQLLGNWTGSMINFIHNPKVSGSMPFNGNVRFENSVTNGWWTSELSVRAEELQGAKIVDGETWGLNFTRCWHNPFNYSAWPSIIYLTRENYAKITLDQGAPVVQLLDFKDPQGGRPGFTFSLLNPTKAEMQLVVHTKVSDGAANGKVAEETKPVKLPPGGRDQVTWQTDWALKDGETSNILSAEVTSADGATKFFTTTMPFDHDNGRKAAWVAPETKVIAAIDMKVCFYPGFSRLRCQVNFAALKVASMVNKATVIVKNAADKEIAKGAEKTFVDGEGEIVVQLPKPLAEGKYTATLSLLADNKTIGEPVQKSFDKMNFPFENNAIGITDKVLPPWTPMRWQGSGVRGQVDVWNRMFMLGEDGFFTQVKSGLWELLSRPVHLEARSGGKTLVWKGQGVKFGSKADNAVDFTVTSSCAKINAEIGCHSEFDGMFQYTVKLMPQGDGKVDGLDLVVPLKEDNAWLLHATSDGCRSNASLFTPSGEGRVWDSTQVMQWRLTGSFIPYLWLGSDRAGLCWWADSEKGWVRPPDKKSPAIEVRRQKGEVQMVFHLIARPFQLKEPRTIVFAFNATPVRPRPSWARSWTNISGKADGFLKGPHVRVDGSCSWVSFGKDSLPDRAYTYASLRPISDEADTWLKEHAGKYHDAGATLVPYTDLITRAVDRGDEVKHYASEWDRYNNPHPQEETLGWPSNGGVSVNMTKSRIDYDLWCMKHDVELGVDGFYSDEIQSVGQINPVAELGFRDEAGNWEAETSLFAMRTYFKRQYAMLQEMGRLEPVITPHTSSTMYAGPLAFVTLPMDLEMSSPDPDPQRGQVFGLGEGYAMCNIMAWHHGFVGSGMICPAPHAAVAQKDFRLIRTFLGSMLLFDCRSIYIPVGWAGQFDYALGQFGMSEPGVEYVPYWRTGDLQTIEPAGATRVSLFRNQDKALLVMYNDSPKAVTVHWQPKARFECNGRFTIPEKDEPDRKAADGVNQAEDGSLQVEIRPYDYRLVMVPTKGAWGSPNTWGAVDPKLFERNVKPASKSP